MKTLHGSTKQNPHARNLPQLAFKSNESEYEGEHGDEHEGRKRHAAFSVRRIVCIGRNYAEHAREMGHNPASSQPFFFYKPITALLPVDNTATFELPHYSNNVHHELELALAIGSAPSPEHPLESIAGVGIALDMTCRDIQQHAKQHGRPWDTAKGFDHSAPCSHLAQVEPEQLAALSFTLAKNGVTTQTGNVSDMIWPPSELLLALMQFTQLDYGDLILTGTPQGVGAVTAGDTLHARCSTLELDFTLNVGL